MAGPRRRRVASLLKFLFLTLLALYKLNSILTDHNLAGHSIDRRLKYGLLGSNSTEISVLFMLAKAVQGSKKVINAVLTQETMALQVRLKTTSSKSSTSSSNQSSNPKPHQPSECLASKIFQKLDSTENGNFGYSVQPRLRKALEKTKKVRYFVGDVIVHKKYGYRGVIAGWDAVCRAPTMWIVAMHKGVDLEYAKNIPHYKVLVDNRDRKFNQITYVAEFNIVWLSHQDMTVRHANVFDYFDHYDREKRRYVMRDAIRTLYPDDDRTL